MTSKIQPAIYSGRKYRYPSGKRYWLVKCQFPVPTPEDPLAMGTYQKKHDSLADAEFDKVRLIREYSGGGSISISELHNFEAAKHRLAASVGPANGKSITFAVDWFISHYKGEQFAPTIEEVMELFRTRHVSQLREHSRAEYERYLPLLMDRFGKEKITDVTIDMLQAHVETFGGGIHHRKCLIGFFTFCCGGSKRIQSPHRWIMLNPAKFISIRSDDEEEDEEVVILSIEEVKSAIALSLIVGDAPFWIWSLFTGMRPEETRRFWTIPGHGWEKINLPGSYIAVSGKISKTKKFRKIQIRPALREWLHYFQATEEPMYPACHRLKFREIRLATVDDHKVNVRDILRHTFISFRLHLDGSMGATCIEAGNSERVVKEHYYDLITTEAEVDEFWSLGPSAFGLQAPSTMGGVIAFESGTDAEQASS